MSTDLHIMLFPYLLYPGQMMAMTGSIFMIVAIAFERWDLGLRHHVQQQ